MKTFYFNIQSKGGAGKSMLTYLQALKLENDDNAFFIDLDNSTRTSGKQLKFISAKSRLIETDIIDEFHRIEREKLFGVFEELNDTAFSTFYLDFGAPESEQFPKLFRWIIQPGNLKLSKRILMLSLFLILLLLVDRLTLAAWNMLTMLPLR